MDMWPSRGRNPGTGGAAIRDSQAGPLVHPAGALSGSRPLRRGFGATTCRGGRRRRARKTRWMMVRAVLDACVLYPTVLREILIGAADAGLYAPLWSA